MFQDAITKQIAGFIASTGLEIEAAALDGETFLPGILVEKGKILVDETRLAYPGDILHEAGHLALASGEDRASLSGEVVLPGVERMEPVEASAIAWSYAAVLHLGLDPGIIFHTGGYGGRSEGLKLNFDLGVYIGLGGLQEAGLTAFGDRAADLGISPYPNMIKWLRD